MTERPRVWIAPTGLRVVDPDATQTAVPVDELLEAGLSFLAIGLYGELLSYQGKPVDPYENQLDAVEDISDAIDQLVKHGYAVRVGEPPTAGLRDASR